MGTLYGICVACGPAAIGLKLYRDITVLVFEISIATIITEMLYIGITATNSEYAQVVLDEKLKLALSKIDEFAKTLANELRPRLYTVYVLVDGEGTERYVGRTKNLDTRLKAHEKSEKNNLLVEGGHVSSLTYEEARGMEQTLMAYYHTRNWLNEMGNNDINGVSPKNKRKKEYFDKTKDFLTAYSENQAENEYLNAMEDLGTWY